MRKQNGRKHKFSLFLSILVSALIFTLISVVGKLTIYQEYNLNLWKTPILTVMFEAAKDGVYPWDIIDRSNGWEVQDTDSELVMANGLPKEEGSKPSQIEDSQIGSSQTENSQTENSSSEIAPSKPAQSSNNQTESSKSDGKDEIDQGGKENSKKEEQKEEETSTEVDTSKKEENSEETESGKNNSESEKKDDVDGENDSISEEEKSKKSDLKLGEVEQAYFDDALFIGDSRTVGLSEYSYLDNATYYSDVGLSVYSVFDKKIAKIGKKSVTLEEALKKTQFKKIYIMLGINELGTGTTKTFVAKYEEMLDRIEQLQPDAYIMIQAIMNIGKERSDSDKIYNNKNITDRNEGLETLADDKKVFYINVNEVITDEEGYLPENYTFDSVHLKGKYYDKWADFLMEHGIVEK